MKLHKIFATHLATFAGLCALSSILALVAGSWVAGIVGLAVSTWIGWAAWNCKNSEYEPRQRKNKIDGAILPMCRSAATLRENRLVGTSLLFGVAIACLVLYLFQDSGSGFGEMCKGLGACAGYFAGILTLYEIITWLQESCAQILARERASRSTKQFYLVLHSFSAIELVEGNYQHREDFGDESVISHDVVVDSVINRIEEAIRPQYELVSIGSFYSRKNSIVFHSDARWSEILRLLVPAANGIIFIPGMSSGCMHELEFLITSGAWQKTIVFMTPQTEWASDSLYHKRAFGWKHAQAALARRHLRLPDYDPNGMLFLINEDWSIKKSAQLGRVKYIYQDCMPTFSSTIYIDHEDTIEFSRHIREALANLQGIRPMSGRPIAEIYPQIAQIDFWQPRSLKYKLVKVFQNHPRLRRLAQRCASDV